MKRRWNLPLYAGFLITVVSFIGYFVFFAYYPVTRDVPWADLILFAVGLLLLGIGLRRAYRQPERYRGRISGPILTVLSLAVIGFFLFYVFYLSQQIPASAAAPQVGAPAPDFTLPDSSGNPVSLSSLLVPASSGPETAQGQGQWVLLVFYRGYW